MLADGVGGNGSAGPSLGVWAKTPWGNRVHKAAVSASLTFTRPFPDILPSSSRNAADVALIRGVRRVHEECGGEELSSSR